MPLGATVGCTLSSFILGLRAGLIPWVAPLALRMTRVWAHYLLCPLHSLHGLHAELIEWVWAVGSLVERHAGLIGRTHVWGRRLASSTLGGGPFQPSFLPLGPSFFPDRPPEGLQVAFVHPRSVVCLGHSVVGSDHTLLASMAVRADRRGLLGAGCGGDDDRVVSGVCVCVHAHI